MTRRLVVAALATISLSGAGPGQAGGEVRKVLLTTPVRVGGFASVTVRVSGAARCRITFSYSDIFKSRFASTSKALVPKSGGQVTWRWRVDRDTRPGAWPVVVRCGPVGTLRLRIQVQPPVPDPIAGQGFSYVFGDEFGTFDPTVWSRSIWYEPAASGADLYVEDGSLRLLSRRANGYPVKDVTTRLSARKARSFRHGYFEARMRWTSGRGAWPSFWLFSTSSANQRECPPLIAELDIFEGDGALPAGHHGTLHRNTSNRCGVPDSVNSNYSTNDVGFDLSRDWHVYAALWTETEVRWFVDGRELKRWGTFDSTDQDMFLILRMDAWDGQRAVDSTTPNTLSLDVDWVRVWQQ